MVRLAGFEPTASASAGLRSIQLSYKRTVRLPARPGAKPTGEYVVPRARVELARPCGHYALNVARLPFRHFGIMTTVLGLSTLLWWAILDLNQ